MPNHPETLESKDWHRYFAVETNNRAWQLSERSRSSDEDMEMLDSAHAAFVAGEADLYRSCYALAKTAVEAIADEEDREIVLRTFNQVPVPA